MSTYPITPRSAFLQWCDTHAPVFIANAAVIGMTAAQATAFASQLSKSNDAVQDQDDAKQAQKAATEIVDGCVAELKTMAGDAVRTIRAFAEMQADPTTVYAKAQIPSPATPTPIPPPGQPTNLTVTIAPGSGQLTLKWKCENPEGASGTSYLIRRKLPTETAFTVIGASGIKEFIDASFVAGPDSVTYTIQGLRSNLQGPESDWFTINFGSQTGGGGGFTTSVMPQGRVNGSVMNAGDAALVDAIVNSKGNGSLKRTPVRG